VPDPSTSSDDVGDALQELLDDYVGDMLPELEWFCEPLHLWVVKLVVSYCERKNAKSPIHPGPDS